MAGIKHVEKNRHDEGWKCEIDVERSEILKYSLHKTITKHGADDALLIRKPPSQPVDFK